MCCARSAECSTICLPAHCLEMQAIGLCVTQTARFAAAGLRTLVVGARTMGVQEYHVRRVSPALFICSASVKLDSISSLPVPLL
jgi:hypothetical protein